MARRAQGADPRSAQLFRYLPSVCGTQLGIAVLFFYLWDVLGLRFLTLPAVTSASEVLTQTYRGGRVVQWPASWAHDPKLRKEQSLERRLPPDEKMETLHLPAPNVELTVLAQDQTDYKGVKVECPFSGLNGVCLLPNELDKKVAKLHLPALKIPLFRLISRRRP